jgi:hypothetical protein
MSKAMTEPKIHIIEKIELFIMTYLELKTGVNFSYHQVLPWLFDR